MVDFSAKSPQVFGSLVTVSRFVIPSSAEVEDLISSEHIGAGIPRRHRGRFRFGQFEYSFPDRTADGAGSVLSQLFIDMGRFDIERQTGVFEDLGARSALRSEDKAMVRAQERVSRFSL